METLYLKAILYKSLMELGKATAEDLAAYLIAKGIEVTPQKVSQYLINMSGIKTKKISYKTIYFIKEK